MDRNYLINSGRKRARLARLIAKAIDLLLVLALSLVQYPLGMILAVVYLGLSDYLQGGQSVGKRLIGFQVVSLKDGAPCSLKQSWVRNLPFIIPLGFAVIPVWGWIFGIIFSNLLLIELYLLFKIDSAHRLGDVLADTTVIADDPTREDLRAKDGWFRDEKNMSPCNRSQC